jgi:choline dehydrogenase-like flavoprotein
MQIIRNRTEYDVCVIGSGAGGGMAAMVLTQAGANVVMLEAGPFWDATLDTAMYKWPYQTPRRGAATPERHFGEFDAALGGWSLDGEPYTSAAGSQFDWFRSRMLGGRTNHWGRISLRFGPDDFRRKSIDGLGDDWPISYDDIKPYYDKIDRFIGIFGTNLPEFPNEPDGIFLPPPTPRCYELLIQRASKKLDVPSVPSRLSILTRPHNGRAACHYCSQCGRGCSTHSNFSSPSVLIPPAMKTGRLKILYNAMAREVTVDNAGLASGVTYVDKTTARDNHVRAKIVVVAGSACESARILLNSKSAKFPEGLGNSSGNVGKYLTDSTGAGVRGFIPALMDGIPHNEDGTGGMHLYTPWWLDNKKLDFPRGYHIELYGGREMPGWGFMNGIQWTQGGGYGAALKEDYRRLYGSFVWLAGRGEMIPNEGSYCELDPSVVDKWGIPVLRFHWKWSEHELNQARHHNDTFAEIIDKMGGRLSGTKPPRTSVLNRWCQAHDAKNVFVADSGPFVSNAHKNMTWTILALSMRTSEHIAEERNKGNL